MAVGFRRTDLENKLRTWTVVRIGVEIFEVIPRGFIRTALQFELAWCGCLELTTASTTKERITRNLCIGR